MVNHMRPHKASLLHEQLCMRSVHDPHAVKWCCRVTLNQASVSLNADAIMTAVRDFMERSARENSAKEEASGRKVSSHMPHMQILWSLAHAFACNDTDSMARACHYVCASDCKSDMSPNSSANSDIS